MIIDHPHCLHEGVGRCRSEKLPAAFLQVFAQSLGGFCDAGNRGSLLAFANVRFSEGRGPSPDIGGQTAKFIDDFDCSTSVVDGRLDFSTVTNNALIPEEAVNVFVVVKTGDLCKIKFSERFSEVFTLTEDR